MKLEDANGNLLGPISISDYFPFVTLTLFTDRLVSLKLMSAGESEKTRIVFDAPNVEVFYTTTDCSGTGYLQQATSPDIVTWAAVMPRALGYAGSRPMPAQTIYVGDKDNIVNDPTRTSNSYRNSAGCYSAAGGSGNLNGSQPVLGAVSVNALGVAPFRIVRIP